MRPQLTEQIVSNDFESFAIFVGGVLIEYCMRFQYSRCHELFQFDTVYIHSLLTTHATQVMINLHKNDSISNTGVLRSLGQLKGTGNFSVFSPCKKPKILIFFLQIINYDKCLRNFERKTDPCLRIFSEKVTHLGGTSPYSIYMRVPRQA